MAVKSISLDQLPQIMNLSVLEGDDLTWQVTIKQGDPLIDLPWSTVDLDGIVAKVVHPNVETVDEDIDFTTPVDGLCILSLTDTQISTLGPGLFIWFLQVTSNEYSITYAKGSLKIVSRPSFVQ